MDPDTFRGDIGVEGPDVYWRRRVSVLTGALVVVAVVAWACTSASGGSDDPPDGRPKQESLTQASPPSPPARGAAQAPAPVPDRARNPGEPCGYGDLVLSLHGDSEVYSGGRRPRFMLSLVNIGQVECALDIGPRAVEMRITSGDDRVWSTADCVSGDHTEMRRLRRGIPEVKIISWDRHRSAPDCRAARPLARPGTYVAAARLGSLTSTKVVFHLH
ncbi:hypothetical protein [Sphaerisporangium fuscum]|uniref:hypothetical protein n=1 Tax=Sphaerisporangium fuscum TaxID=2835868 RepID=UPI001BDD0A2B|nr:hypothetical protein [Sphaerisporangium fuscum]